MTEMNEINTTTLVAEESGQDQAARAERAHLLDRAVHECARDISRNFYRLAALLLFLKEEKLYRDLGYESFQAYVASVDIAFSFNHIRLGMRVVKAVLANEPLRQHLEAKLGSSLESLAPTKLDMVLPAVKKLLASGQEDQAVDLLAAARKVSEGGISRSDLKRLLQETGHAPAQYKRYLCIKAPQEVKIVEATSSEELWTAYDIVIENPHIVKGTTSIAEEERA